MSRIRSIKPEFFLDDELAELPPLTRLLFIGLWTLADCEGRLEDRPKRIRAQVLPFDDGDTDAMLQALHDHRFVCRYTVDGNRLIKILDVQKWQSPRLSSDEWAILRRIIFKRDDFTCAYCGARGERLECDHVIPVSRGGSNDLSNLAAACKRCNRDKRDRTPEEWKP